MSLSAGTRLGPYEILVPIGAGGMGDVYKARDPRLDRIVAIKVCKEAFSDRFEREARTVAALNHPHICTLHDVGPNYLVMEYIEGQPIKGPLPLDRVLQYAAQICDALDAAHRKGIIHRDLKPANILLTRAGVKVLDYGLARTKPVVTADDTTVTQALTGKGQIVGTLQYMSPEQLQGQEADARSDIFSFGLVLHEMLTGKRAFEGASPASLIGAILERPAPSVAAVAPAALDRLLSRCLEKDRENRWQTARDLKAQLEWIAAGDFGAPPTVARRAMFPWIAGAAAAGAACGAGFAEWAWRGKGTPPRRAIRFQLQLPGGSWRIREISRQSLALSPVGGRLAMIATSDRRPMIWVHRLDSLTPSPLSGTEGADTVFWSPDGQFIGFWAGGKLKKTSADGGTPVPICDLPALWSATWNQEGIIVAESARGISSHISVQSGMVSPGRPLLWPKFLPDGKHLLYVKIDAAIGGYRAYVAELSAGVETALMPTSTYVTFVPDPTGSGSSREGYLIFGRGGTLLSVRFDTGRLRVLGEPIPVAKDVPFFSARAWSEFDASADGVLVYSTGSEKSQLTWLDRSGQEKGTVGEPQGFWQVVRISPNGRKLVADVGDFSVGGVDIWTYDLAQGTAERVTFEPGSESWPVWSPDGTRIAFASSQSGPPRLVVKAVGDRGGGTPVDPSPFQLPTDWSSDGRWIFFQTVGGGGQAGIWVASVADRKITPLVSSDSAFPALSPNRDYLAFSSTETGRSEIYAQRFLGDAVPKLVGERLRISHEGGSVPRWRRDGKELFFLSPDPERLVMAAAVKAGEGRNIEFGPPAALFPVPSSASATGSAVYEVSPDGQRFLVPIRKTSSPPLHIVINWRQGLKQ